MRTYAEVTNHELEGTVLIVPTAYGGRSTPVFSGYRGQFFWHINHEPCTDWLAETYFENDKVDPGEPARCKIKLAGTILDLGRSKGISAGSQFALREGARIIAVGTVTESLFEEAAC